MPQLAGNPPLGRTVVVTREGTPIEIAAKLIESYLSTTRTFAGLARNYLNTGHFKLANENLVTARSAFADAQQTFQSISKETNPERWVLVEARIHKLGETLAELTSKLKGSSPEPQS